MRASPSRQPTLDAANEDPMIVSPKQIAGRIQTITFFIYGFLKHHFTVSKHHLII
jgi:hypothetical protein